MGRESWSAGPLERGGATRRAPRASSSAATGRQGQDRTETKKSNKRQAGKEASKEAGKKKGIEQLGFWKEGRRKENNRTVKDAPKGP